MTYISEVNHVLGILFLIGAPASMGWGLYKLCMSLNLGYLFLGCVGAALSGIVGGVLLGIIR